MSNPTVELLRSHRTVRRYTDAPLPEGLLEELVACGQQASTSSNLQAYSIIRALRPHSARIVATMAKLLQEKGSGRGLISVCTAGGMGVSAIMEAA